MVIDVLIICCNIRRRETIPFAKMNSSSLHIVNKKQNSQNNGATDDADKCNQIISLI
jgi:Icc-related predicted phosphoesterase